MLEMDDPLDTHENRQGEILLMLQNEVDTMEMKLGIQPTPLGKKDGKRGKSRELAKLSSRINYDLALGLRSSRPERGSRLRGSQVTL